MTNNQSNSVSYGFEDDLYAEILDYFQKDMKDEREREMWKNRVFIRLMNEFEKAGNSNIIKNALILILNLFDDLPPDIYNTRGRTLESINSDDRRKVIEKLKQEYL